MPNKNWSSRGWAGKLWAAQGGKCCYCETPMVKSHKPKKGRPISTNIATFEHLKPRSQGGEHNLSNLALACFECNSERNNMPWNLFKSMKLGEILN